MGASLDSGTSPASAAEFATSFTQADLVAAVDQSRSAPSYRYEYFQQVLITGRSVVGSLDVPVVRGEVRTPSTTLTAEMGVALDFGQDTNTRMNLISTPDQVCLNVPFYARVLEERVDDEFLWMEPLVDGWGCIDSARLADDAAVYAALGIGNTNQFVGVLDPIAMGTVLSSVASDFRGEPALLVEVLVPLSDLLQRLPIAPDGGPVDGTPIPAKLRIDTTGRILSAQYGFTHDGQQISERVEFFDFDNVDAIALPNDAADVTEPMLELLGQRAD